MRENWKTGSRSRTVAPASYRGNPPLGCRTSQALRRGTTRRCSTDPRPYSVAGSIAPLLCRPLCRCRPNSAPFHPCGSPPQARSITPSGMGKTVTPSRAHPLALSLGASSSSGAPSPHPLPSPPVVQPLAPGRYKVQFTASAGLHEKLERLRALMRSQVPDGDLGAIIEAAVTEKLERLEARRFAATTRPRKDLSTTDTSPSSRRIPAAVRRAVHERDGGRCRYVDASGRRCEERHHLEYHHLHPFGLGGDHRPENIRLMCAQHNAYLAEHDYGREAMARFRRSRRTATQGASGTPARALGVATVASAGTAGGPGPWLRAAHDREALRAFGAGHGPVAWANRRGKAPTPGSSRPAEAPTRGLT